MESLKSFKNEEIDLSLYSSSFGMGETTTTCQEETYQDCGDTYYNYADDEGNTAFSFTTYKDCPTK